MAEDTQTLHGLDDVLAKLKALPPEIVSKSGGPVKTALRKGAKVIADEWKANVQRIIDEPNVGGVPTRSTGLLKGAIAVTRDSRPQRAGANERYVVRVRRKKYPREDVTTAQVARLLEYGTEKMQAKPWAAPGYLAKRQEALDTVVRELRAGVDRAVRKVSRMGGKVR
jgi:HK97 gp10 family phage protein